MYRNRINHFLCYLLILCVFLCGCAGQDSALSYIKRGSGDLAALAYEKEVAGKAEMEKNFEIALENFLTLARDELNNEKMSLSQAKGILDAVDALPYSVLSDCESVISDFMYLVASKQSYADGLQAISSGDYLSGYRYLCNVIPDDINYNSAQNQKNAAYTNGVDPVYDEVTRLTSSGDYQSAILVVNNAIDTWGTSEFLDGLQSLVYSQWEDAVLTQAESAFVADKDYEAAIRILQLSGLNSERVNSAIARYQAYAPIQLRELTPTRKGDQLITSASYNDAEDVNGHQYLSDAVIRPWSGGPRTAHNESELYVVYYLGANYSKLNGIIYRPYSSLSVSDESWNAGTAEKIYGDGVLLYDGPVITRNTYEEFEFQVDVTGVRELKIVLLGVGFDQYAYSSPLVCMANLELEP